MSSMENEQANPGRPAKFVLGGQILGRDRRQGKKTFFLFI